MKQGLFQKGGPLAAIARRLSSPPGRVTWRLITILALGTFVVQAGCGAPVDRSQGPPAGQGGSGLLLATPSPDQIRAGREYFFWGPCGECHTIQGTRAQGRVGPDLTNFASRPRVNILPNTPENVERWIGNPQAVNPKAYMPNLDLPGDIIGKLTAYLETLR